MTSFSVGVRIWARTLIMNAVLWAIGGMLTGKFFAVISSFFFLSGGFVATLPLLMLIVPLVKVSTWLPYSAPAKIAWLTFWLAILIFLIYIWVSMMFDGEVFKENSEMPLILATVLGGLLFAVISTRKYLKEFYSAS